MMTVRGVTRLWSTLCLVALTGSLACQADRNGAPAADLTSQGAPLVADGNFASGGWTAWQLDLSLRGTGGLLAVPPKTTLDLTLSPNTGFADKTMVVTGAPQSLLPSRPTMAAESLRLPFANPQCAAINLNGNSLRASTIGQDYVFVEQDRDPQDNRLRLRAIVAPLMSGSATHQPANQSFFLARLGNVARSMDSVAQYYVGASAVADGRPWQYVRLAGSQTITDQYYGWQVVELTPSILDALPGETLHISLTAAGCSAGGHYGSAYVDAVGNYALGSASLVAVGPEVAQLGGKLRYVLRYRQQSEVSGASIAATFALPAMATIDTFAPPSSWQCALDANQVVMACQVPAMPAASLPVATDVPLILDLAQAATSPLVLGDYGVQVSSQPLLRGPFVSTKLIADANQLSDLVVTVSQDLAHVSSKLTRALVVVSNRGPAATTSASIQSVVGAGLQVTDWQCTAGAGAGCGASGFVGGNGNFALEANFAAGAQVECQVDLTPADADGGTTFGVAALVGVHATEATAYDSEAVARISFQAPAAAAASDLGAACTADAGCSGGHCADGVCCETACTAACYACNLPGTTGTCAAMTSSDGVPLLGHATCGPYACDAGSCRTSCGADADCISGFACQEHICRPIRGVCQQDADCPAGRYCTPAKTCESSTLVDPNHPNWRLQGSGCQHGAASPVSGVLALLALVWRSRRRRGAGRTVAGPAIVLLLALLGAQTRVQAAEQAAVPTNFYLPLGGVDDLYGVASARVAPLGALRVGIWLNYAHVPLRLQTTTLPRIDADLVRHQGTLDLTAGISLPLRLELGVALPAVLQQSDTGLYASDGLSPHRQRASLGDLRLTPKLMLWQGEWVRLAALVVVGAPTGRRNEFVSSGAWSFAPMGALELGRSRGAKVLLNVGASLRPRRQLADLQLHNALRWSVAAQWPWQLSEATELHVQASVFGESDLKKGHTVQAPTDLVAGLGLGWRNGLGIDIGGGTGLTNGYGAPRWRVLVGLQYRRSQSEVAPPPEPAPPAALASSVPAEAAPSVDGNDLASLADRDHDGVPDAVDQCPDLPGPADGPTPGCPPPAASAKTLQALTLHSFANNSAELPSDNAALLEQVRQLLAADSSLRLTIEGHTDRSGRPKHNQLLSQARAQAAADWLVAHGIDAGRLVVTGYGATRPAEPGDGAAQRAHNRRILFVPMP